MQSSFSVSPSHEQQISASFCSVGHSSMGYNPSGTACSHVGPPTGSQVLPGNLQWRLLLLWAHKSRKVLVVEQVSHSSKTCFQASTCSSAGVIHGLRVDSASLWIFMSYRDASASPCSSPGTAGEFQLWCLEHLIPLLLHLPWCLQSCSFHVFSLRFSLSGSKYSQLIFFFLLKYVTTESLL